MGIEQIIKKGNFTQVESIEKKFNGSNLLSKGILEPELENLIISGDIEIEKSKKANSAFALKQLGNGLNISFNYGSQNKDYVSVIIFDDKNLKKKLGHSPDYISSYSQIRRGHKLEENPDVLRIDGTLNSDDIRYLLIRKMGETSIYRKGIDTNPNVILLNSSKKTSPKSNIILGEYHFKTEDQKIQREVISDLPKLDYIISEVLEDDEIISKSDVKRLLKNPQFNPKLESHFVKPFGYNTSKSYLLDWFEEFDIPIIGLGNFEDKIKSEIKIHHRENSQTLNLIGRNHISEMENLCENYQTYIPSYDIKSHIK